MKVPAMTMAVCLSAAFFLSGCRGEEPTSLPSRPPKIVKSIVRPVPQEKTAKTAAEGHDLGQSADVEGEGEVKSGSAEAREIGNGKEASSGPEEEGYYVIKKGDTLSRIAAREEIYGDPLKWPILLRYNLKVLGYLPPERDFPDKELPVGMKLRWTRVGGAETEKGPPKPWVVNVLSARTSKRIVPAAVTLIREGHPMYVTRAVVKGKEWIRLRAGFFENKDEAQALGKKIQKMLKLEDPWPTKAEERELAEFRGF